ncbi:holo-ACP synthase [Neobacillus dielmonensis]|uniref:holo-ACP synthase n=1 Tax=Neobacillus dielmonensis TaxID=1347369 RepID=UPI0005A65945|nr:holo-ACP synthase [Neobacillus dielmonensis]
MIKGIGTDIIEISRIKILLQKQPKFADRVLTPHEKQKYEGLSLNRQAEFLAGRFAAKEAYSKAAGTGIGKELSFLDIEIGTAPSGKPYFRKPEGLAHLSISHSREYAVAHVIIEQEDF